jgi:uncharacterized protein YycO
MRQPQRGDYGLAHGGGLAMWLVRLGTRSRWGHACIYLSADADTGLPVIFEAMPGGARVRTAKPGEFVWSNLPLTDGQRGSIVAASAAMDGTPYDWWAIGRLVLRGLGARWLRSRSYAERPRRIMCSGWVATAYRDVGVDLGADTGRAPADVTPGDLADVLVVDY